MSDYFGTEINVGGKEKQTGTNQVWQDGDIRIRWKEVLRAQLGIFILPVIFFFIAFGTIPAFSGQTCRVRKSGERNQMEDVAKQFFTLLFPNWKYTEKLHTPSVHFYTVNVIKTLLPFLFFKSVSSCKWPKPSKQGILVR